MNSRQINLILWSGAAMLAIGAIACASLTLLWPLNTEVATDRDVTASASTQPSSLPPVESLQAVANVQLRRVTAVAATQSITAGSELASDTPPFTLAGTIGTSRAFKRSNEPRIFNFPPASNVAASHNVKISTFIIQATAQLHVHEPKINVYASSKSSPSRRLRLAPVSSNRDRGA